MTSGKRRPSITVIVQFARTVGPSSPSSIISAGVASCNDRTIYNLTLNRDRILQYTPRAQLWAEGLCPPFGDGPLISRCRVCSHRDNQLGKIADTPLHLICSQCTFNSSVRVSDARSHGVLRKRPHHARVIGIDDFTRTLRASVSKAHSGSEIMRRS